MKRSDIIRAIQPVVDAFDELGILYYIGGSVASSSYGIARTTIDIDLVLNLGLNDIKPLVEKLKKEYFIDSEMIKDAIKTKSSFNIIHLETMMKIDIFILKDNYFHKEVFNRKRKDILQDENEEIKIFLCSPEDIILNKLEWYELGGRISERQWLDILGVIKVQNKLLDKNYLLKWAEELKLIDLLKKAFEECALVL